MSDDGAGIPLKVAYPFMRTTYQQTDFDEDSLSTSEVSTWQPGIRGAKCAVDFWGEATVYYVDGVGWQILTIVSRHKPGRRYPERVFYTQTWVDPDGKAFGSTKLRMTTARRFAQMCHEYAHPYRVIEKEEP